jgi:hypothetical protein
MALGVLACGAISSAFRLSPLRHQPTIGTFASSMADEEGHVSCLLSYSQKASAILPGARGADEIRGERSIYRKNLLKSQKVRVKPILMRRDVMSGA